MAMTSNSGIVGVGHDYSDNYYDMIRMKAVGLCVSTKKRYNIFLDPCSKGLMWMEDYDADQPNPREDQQHKGEILGLNCWEVLAEFTGYW